MEIPLILNCCCCCCCCWQVEGLGYSFPRLKLPITLIYICGEYEGLWYCNPCSFIKTKFNPKVNMMGFHEKLCFLAAYIVSLLNKRSELVTRCCYENKFFATTNHRMCSSHCPSNFKLKTFTVMIALLVCETTSYNFYSLIAFEFCSA